MAALKSDSRTVLKLRVTSLSEEALYTPGQDLYLRGAVYERYDGRRWSSRYDPKLRTAGTDGWITVDPGLRASRDIRQEIVPLPAPGDPIVALGEPVRLKWPKATYDDAGVFFLGAVEARRPSPTT